MTLPVNVDSTYADSGSDASVALHQKHHDTIHAAVNGPYVPAGFFKESLPRMGALVNASALTSGTLRLQAQHFEVGEVVTSITVVSGTTAANTPLNQWMALYDSARAKLATTADQTTGAWAANTAKSFDFVGGSGAYTILTSGLYYVGIVVVATTTPTLFGIGGNAFVTGLPPILAGNSSTNQTTPALAPATAAAITASGTLYYATFA